MMNVQEIQVHGRAVVVMESELLSLTIVAGKGADIVSFIHKPTATEFLWESPKGMDVLLKPDGEQKYIGGWLETFPNAWGKCVHKGRELINYGEAWQRSWAYQILRNDQEQIQVAFTVQCEELPLLLSKVITLTAGDPNVRIDETALNTGEEVVEFTWGHHPNIGRPFLTEDCVIELPACDIMSGNQKIADWPFLPENEQITDLRTIPKFGTSTENRLVFIQNMQEHKAAIRNSKTGISFKLAWDGATFTDLLIWRAFMTDWSEGFGDNQILCFFPKRSHYNVAEASRRGETITLAPNDKWQTWIEAGVEVQPVLPLS